MTPRSITSPALVRLLGGWRDDGRPDPAYRQLAEAVRMLILDGRLALDVRLPGERELATALGVSRTTVSTAFAQLREQGHLVSRHGSGSRTSVPVGPGATAGHRAPGALVGGEPADGIDLGAAAMPAASGVHAAYASALAALPAHLPGHGYESLGLPALREAIAARYVRRGLPTTPDQVLVTLGAQHAFSLVLQLLVGPGDRVLIDHPTYPHALDAIARASARPVPVPLPPTGGWDVDGVAAALRQAGPRLAYLLPDFHNPTGRCMTPEERATIAAAAGRARTTLVIDETMADLGLDGPPPAPFAVHDRDGVVITLGSMSKGYWGGLRVGWIRAETPTIAALAGVRPAVDLGTPIVEQLACAALLTDDEERLRERRERLRGQRDRLLAAVATHLPEWHVPHPPGGNSVWAELPDPVSSALAASAERHGVRVIPGPRFGADGAFERFIRLPYTRPADELEEAVERLARAYDELGVGARTQPAGVATAGAAAVV